MINRILDLKKSLAQIEISCKSGVEPVRAWVEYGLILKQRLEFLEQSFKELFLTTPGWDVFLRLHKIKNPKTKKIDKIEIVETEDECVQIILYENLLESYTYRTDIIKKEEFYAFLTTEDYYKPLLERYKRIYGHGLL